MNIKTLEFIHRLLEDEVAKTHALYQSASSTLQDCKDAEYTRRTIQNAEANLNTWRNAYNKAYAALEDFESHEWR